MSGIQIGLLYRQCNDVLDAEVNGKYVPVNQLHLKKSK